MHIVKPYLLLASRFGLPKALHSKALKANGDYARVQPGNLDLVAVDLGSDIVRAQAYLEEVKLDLPDSFVVRDPAGDLRKVNFKDRTGKQFWLIDGTEKLEETLATFEV